MMPLQFRPTTGNIILKEGAIVNLLVGFHLSSNKLSLGSLIPTGKSRNEGSTKEDRIPIESFGRTTTKNANQSLVNPLFQAQPSAPSPLSSQPLPNPKGGFNAVQVEMDNEEEDEAEDEEGENDWLYELLKELENSDDEEDEESEDETEEEDEYESTEEDSEDEFVEEGDQAEEEARKKIGIKERFSS
ncbi:hypothetical protein PIB30_097452 [Stylosanthes scabra]|uniref:Uncharacterized protein n=1 Tax=Stylosanthes scabra TaxID=79078 RepID=A0ABU6VVB6_9FABA|nr:hypothetical protein [Stylosanthes scabra]